MVFSAIPQVITEDRASGAQVVEGSLRFDGGYLQRTPSSIGNRKTFTWSAWIKRSDLTSRAALWGAGTTNGSNNPGGSMYFNSTTGTLQVVNGGGTVFSHVTSAYHRDTGWYHVVIAINTAGTPRVAIYINGEQATASGTIASQNFELDYNNTIIHAIGSRTDDGSLPASIFKGHMSQVYLIDGQALGPEEFGYTDPLTNTWRPKKYNVSKADTVLVGSPTYATSDFKTEGNKTSDQTSLSFGSWTGSTPGAETHIFKNSTDTAFKLNVSLVGGTTDRLLWYSDNLTDWTFVGNTNPSRNYQLSGHKYYATSEGSGATTLHATADGHNTFYLPMDGKSPIGKDQSGNGNDWTPVNFGGSVELSKATGAIPILNTNEAGTVAKRGVRTDSKTYTVTASGGNYYIDGALKPTLNAYRGGSYTFDYTGATSHPFYLSSLQDGKHNSKAYSVEFDGSGDYLNLSTSSDFGLAGGDNFTIECFVFTSAANQELIRQGTANAASDGMYFSITSSGALETRISGTTKTTSGEIAFNSWNHISVCRSGGTLYMSINGVVESHGSVTNSSTTGDFRIGANFEGTSFFTGQVSNVRFVKGQALYTSNFTRPSTTLTTTSQGAIASNVKLLCCQDSNATTGAVLPTGATITANGNASATNTSPFLYNTNGQEGVNTGTSNTTKITIPHWAADTLYYYCQNHSGMGSSINVTTDIFKADPYAWKCVLAIPGGGSISSEVSPQLNVTSSDKTFTQTGTVASSGITNFYGASTDYAANPDAGDQTGTVYSTSSQSSDFAWGAGDFTWEWWMYHHDWDNAGGNLDQVILFQYDGGNPANMIETYIVGHNFSIYQVKSINSYIQFEGNNTIFTLQNNQWVHCALVREGGYYKFFRDGVYLGKSASNTTSWGDSIIVIGRNEQNDLNGFDGLFQDIRMYGTAKYTASTVGEQAFTVPSIVPDVLPDTPSGITGKTNLAKITEGAVAFNGTGDYLSIPGDTDLQMGTGDFTIECYFNLNGAVPTGCWRGMISLGGFTTDHGITIYAPRADAPVDTVVVILNRVNPTIGSTINVKHGWHHVALVRNSGTTKLYVDGIEQSSISDTTNYDYSGSISIGRDPDCTNTYYEGFISNVRIVKGTALYTSNFTPPTEPLTAVTNTTLLCCQSPTSVTAATVTPGSITTSGSPTATNFNPFTDDTNTIRGQETGYATLNPLAKWDGTLSNGNLTMTGGNDIPSTIGASSGKWYAEVTITDIAATLIHIGIVATGTRSFLGAANNGHVLNNMDYLMVRTDSAGPFNAAGRGAIASWSQVSDTGATFTTGDTLSIELDMDNLFVKIYKNNVLRTHFTFTLASTFDKMFFYNRNNGSGVSTWNFGQKPFKFPPPDGFQPLSLSNVQPEKVIARPDQYVGVSLWSGNGTSQTITGLKHKPDCVWIKKRAGGNERSHQLFDSVRGVHKSLHSDGTNSEDTNTGRLTAFNQDGFAVGGDDGANGSGGTFVGWTWKAGGSTGQFNIDDVGYANASDVNMSVGSLNSSVYNDSEVWSTTGTLAVDLNGSTVTNINNPLSNVFEGSLASSSMCTEGTAYTNGTKTYTYTFGTAQTNITSARVYLYQGNSAEGGAAGFGNGTVNKTQDGTYGWVDATSTIPSNGTVTAMTMTTTATSGVNSARNGFIAIELNGKILLDNGVTPTDNFPSIAPTGCSVGTKQGFSIIKYQGNSTAGANISHGLLEAPKLMIHKSLDQSRNWYTITTAIDGSADYLYLNTTSAANNSAVTAPTSSLMYFTSSVESNNNNENYVVYMWHDVPGLQKFGTFNGNGSGAIGPFVELGFRPAIIWIKDVSAAGTYPTYKGWVIYDSKRPGYNTGNGSVLYANRNYEEGKRGQGDSDGYDENFIITSNGFKVQQGAGSWGVETNESGRTYLYCAWAEAPSMNLYGAQANAR